MGGEGTVGVVGCVRIGLSPKLIANLSLSVAKRCRLLCFVHLATAMVLYSVYCVIRQTDRRTTWLWVQRRNDSHYIQTLSWY